MKRLNKHDIEFLINALKSRKDIPLEYKYALFPTKQKEYELVYAGKMRKEDVLADNEEAKAVPLQIEKIFNGKKYPLYSNDWHNLLVFGDNLQVLKTFYKNKDPLIKGKVKGKVKLIYIDPPFATEEDFKGTGKQKAYTDKTKGAEFVEFLRRRLIIGKELLADDGSIFIHLDHRKNHYIKVLMDEISGDHNFLNQITWLRSSSGKTISRNLSKDTDYILWYSKTENYLFYQSFQPLSKSTTRMYNRDDKDGRGKYRLFPLQKTGGPGPETTYDYIDNNGKIWKCPKKGWRMKYEKLKGLENNDRLLLEGDSLQEKAYWDERENEGRIANNLWNDISNLQGANTEIVDYPTQKPEKLLERIIKTCTKKGDLVSDFFAGSGTTLAVAEKLGRRWVGCDIGKLAIYTMQKRFLEINKSKDLVNPKKKYGKPAKSFAIVTSGLYDLGKIFALKKDEYTNFVKRLFEIEETNKKKIGGVNIDGKKRGFHVKIFPYWEFKKTSVDEKYLQELHKNIGRKIEGRFYIIAPANNVDFISDYHQIDNVRYYFLRVPYQIIRELHRVQFKKLRQPQSKKNINDLDDAIGFHFIRQPEVKSEIKTLKKKVILRIKKFESAYTQEETGGKLQNFESLAMLLVDLNYNGEAFLMTKYFFADDLLGVKNEETEEEIKEELVKKKEIKKEFHKDECGGKIMAVYVDIYGNEFKEIFNVN